MTAPLLNRCLVLEAPVSMPDGAGGLVESWAELGTLWAEVSPRSGREALGETGPVAVRAGQTVICVDAVFGDPKLCKGSTLRRQILTIGGAAGIANFDRGHAESVRIRGGICESNRTIYTRYDGVWFPYRSKLSRPMSAHRSPCGRLRGRT